MQPDPQLATVLDDVAGFVRKYVVLTEPQAAAVSLWIVHTHCFDAGETTPYLSISSAEKRSGKSRLLEVLALLVARPLRAAGVTEAALFRSIADRRPSLLMDEVDAIFGPKVGSNHEDLRALLNAGYQTGTPVLRCVGDGSKQTVVEFSVFCPKALAGIGALPDTIADRSIPIRLKRRAPTENVTRFRRREAEEAAEPLHQALVSLGDHHVDRLADARPELPEALDDRAADGWEPLIGIADLAGCGWPERSRRAALVLAEVKDDGDDSLGIRLLADLKAIFVAEDADRLSTGGLLDLLADDEEAPWADWYGKALGARGLARLLSHYAIKSRTVRMADGTLLKGYTRASFEDAWNRYLPPNPVSIRHNGTTRTGTGIAADSETTQDSVVSDTKTASNPHGQTVVPDVSDRTAVEGGSAENGLPGGGSSSPGDPSFPDLIDGAFHNGNVTESEWLERRKLHALLEAVA